MTETQSKFEVGQLVFSIAGRDHGHYYLIYRVEPEANRVYLVDGDKRDAKNPKAKNFSHLQITNVISEEFRDRVVGQSVITTAEIKKYLVQLTIDQ